MTKSARSGSEPRDIDYGSEGDGMCVYDQLRETYDHMRHQRAVDDDRAAEVQSALQSLDEAQTLLISTLRDARSHLGTLQAQEEATAAITSKQREPVESITRNVANIGALASPAFEVTPLAKQRVIDLLESEAQRVSTLRTKCAELERALQQFTPRVQSVSGISERDVDLESLRASIEGLCGEKSHEAAVECIRMAELYVSLRSGTISAGSVQENLQTWSSLDSFPVPPLLADCAVDDENYPSTEEKINAASEVYKYLEQCLMHSLVEQDASTKGSVEELKNGIQELINLHREDEAAYQKAVSERAQLEANVAAQAAATSMLKEVSLFVTYAARLGIDDTEEECNTALQRLRGFKDALETASEATRAACETHITRALQIAEGRILTVSTFLARLRAVEAERQQHLERNYTLQEEIANARAKLFSLTSRCGVARANAEDTQNLLKLCETLSVSEVRARFIALQKRIAVSGDETLEATQFREERQQRRIANAVNLNEAVNRILHETEVGLSVPFGTFGLSTLIGKNHSESSVQSSPPVNHVVRSESPLGINNSSPLLPRLDADEKLITLNEGAEADTRRAAVALEFSPAKDAMAE